ncbi:MULTISPECIES: hypothetical protein [Sphingobium]|uniref:Uncharacterized protein n=1 Tax=Sphingobium tyrosinilyticum TaxID=2715436 RepID=A0ABV9F2J5_9SPHN|nr:hypothetical protein [Sphingobium sp. EP60837]ANI79049.1 hypothetical protein EP837_02654 [Sphingobium sp. EP60837]
MEDGEQRRRINAKRWLWLIVAACVAVAALVTYTSLRAPDPDSRTSEVPLQTTADAQAAREGSRNESQLR